MTKYSLEKSDKKDFKSLNLNKLLVVKLYGVLQDPGYITITDLDERYGKHEKIEDVYFPVVKGLDTIIVKRPLLLIDVWYRPKYVREFLTGVKIPFSHVVYVRDFEITRDYGIMSEHKELDLFAHADIDKKSPTLEETWDYIESHENIPEYKEYLENLKKKFKEAHIDGKRIQNEKVYIKKTRN